jgi:transposase-like protein
MPARKYTHAFEERVCAAYLSKVKPRQIARAFGIPYSTVGTIVRRRGVQRPRSLNLKQQILAAYKPSLSTRDIANTVRSSRSYVWIVLNECGLYQGTRQ